MKLSVGRPKKWKTENELIELMQDYFDNTEFDKYTVTGLCLYLGTNKQTLINYQNNPEFKDIISRAKLLIEHSYEISLREKGRTSDIFALKNFGWTDKQEVDIIDKTDRSKIKQDLDEIRKEIEESDN